MLRDVDLEAYWERIIEENHLQLTEIEDRYPTKRCLVIPFEELNQLNDEFAAQTLERPDQSINAGVAVLKRHVSKEDVGIRITELPGDVLIDISKLRSEHLGKLVSVNGLVRKATQVRPNIRIARFKCMRCPATILEPQESLTLTEPLECYTDQEGCGRTASSTKFRLIAEECYTTDVQKIEVQENPEGLRGGTQPGRITAYLSHEITGKIQPGMRVTLNGILRMKLDEGRTRSTINEIELEVMSFKLDDGDIDDRKLTEEEIAEIHAMSKDPNLLSNLVRSVAPAIRGYEVEKEALLYQLVGGVPKETDDGQKMRGDIHVLLVGDPGVAKTQMIRYMTDLAPRGVYASGKSSSAAGLTAAAVKDEFGEGRWVLEAGALVLADKGLAGVDELDKMSDQDRSALHEAMESQQVTVAKAGITATLQSRFSLLGGANPKFGRFDDNEPIATQIDLPPTLLSRFDLIFAIKDRPNKQRDRDIAEHICRAQMRAGALKHRHDQDAVADSILAQTEDLRPVYEREMIRRYVIYARAQAPILTPQAMESIVEHYTTIRSWGDNGAQTVPITPRQMEAFLRIAEASAKLRLSKYVEEQDAKRAVSVVMYYLRNITLDEDGDQDIDRIVTGTGGKERSKLQTIISVLRNNGQIDEKSLIDICRSKGLEEYEVTKAVRQLLDKGQLYEPKFGVYQLMV